MHVLSKMQLICETLFPPRMCVTITFLTYSSYASQSIAVVRKATFIPVYLFIACQSRDHMSGVMHQNLIGYISAISKLIHFWFHQNYRLLKGCKVSYNRKCSALLVQFRNSQPQPLKLGRGYAPFCGGWLGPHLTQTRLG